MLKQTKLSNYIQNTHSNGFVISIFSPYFNISSYNTIYDIGQLIKDKMTPSIHTDNKYVNAKHFVQTEKLQIILSYKMLP